MPATKIETAANSAVKINNTPPVFEHADTLYAFLGEYAGSNLNSHAWTSWKNIKDAFRFILPHKIKLLAFYNSFKEDITIAADTGKKYVLKSRNVTVIDSINFDARYDIMKSSYKIGTSKFCITSSHGALSVTTTDKGGKFQDNWAKIIGDKDAYTEGIDVFSYKDETGTVCCTEASKVKTFKGRGNATWRMDKKSFKIKFDKSQSCLGMEKTNSLVLLANYQDGTLMRNKFMYDIAHEAKLAFPPNSRYVDLYINGSYKGVHQLSEAHKLGTNKLVKVTDLEDATFKKAQKVTKDPSFDVFATYVKNAYYKTENYSGGTIQYFNIPSEYNPDNNTGGYLIQINVKSHANDLSSAFVTPKGQFIDVLSPEYCTEAQIKYIFDYFVRVENSFYNNDKDYLTLVDVESFAKTYLVHELSKNIDGGVTSTFLYKDKDAIMYAGPVWDYDCALGNLYCSRKDEYGREYDTSQCFGWFTKKIAIPDKSNMRNLYTAVCQIDDVWKKIQSVWKKDFMDAIDIALGKKAPVGSRLKSIDDYAKMLFDAANVNYLIHPLPGTFDWIPCKELKFDGQIKYVIDWLGKRQKWLNDNILNADADYFVFLKQKQGWMPTAYFWMDGEMEPSENKWPGGHMVDVGNSTYRITVPGNANRIIFSNNGSSQTAGIVIPRERNMVYDLGSGKWSKFEIPICP